MSLRDPGMCSSRGAVRDASQLSRILRGPFVAAIMGRPANVPVSALLFLWIFGRKYIGGNDGLSFLTSLISLFVTWPSFLSLCSMFIFHIFNLSLYSSTCGCESGS